MEAPFPRAWYSRSGINLPELREDPLLQTQILVPVLLHQGPLPLDGVVHAAAHGLGQLGADLLLGPLQLDPQGLLVLELSRGEEGVRTQGGKKWERKRWRRSRERRRWRW